MNRGTPGFPALADEWSPNGKCAGTKMGSWSAKPFGNDTALDWFHALEEASDPTLFIRETIQKTGAGSQLDASTGESVIAAAAMVAAAAAEPVGSLPKEMKAWVRHNGYVPEADLLDACIHAVERVASGFELAELWAESSSAGTCQRV